MTDSTAGNTLCAVENLRFAHPAQPLRPHTAFARRIPALRVCSERVVARVLSCREFRARRGQAEETEEPASPANATPAVLTLADATRTAFERNWDLLAAKANVDLVLAQKIVSREFPNPTTSFSSSKFTTAEGNSIGDRNCNTIVAITQLFEMGASVPHFRPFNKSQSKKSRENNPHPHHRPRPANPTPSR